MAKYIINYLDKKSLINKNIYGQFSEHLGRCIYDGVWVGKASPIPNVNGVRSDVIEALKHIKLPILRWPGGCFADTYHWKDGVGKDRKPIANRYWGGTLEDNSFGTHEFMDMCEEIGCGAFLSGNLGSGTIREMVEWVEYIRDELDTPMAQWRRENGREKPWKLEAFGIGNEVWGCGGQMKPDYYADQFRQAAHFVSTACFGGMAAMLSGLRPEKTMILASGPNANDFDFTEKFMKGISGGFMFNASSGNLPADGMSLHYYTFPNFNADNLAEMSGNPLASLRTANDFDENAWYYLLKGAAHVEDLIISHDHIMSQYDPQKKVGLMVDEWGAWHGVEKGTNPAFLFQQNTMRDAVLAALSLNIFNKHSDRVHLTTIAQMVNVLQSIILTEGDKMVLTPTYHVYDMFKGHQNATLLGSFIENSMVGPEGTQVNKLFESSSVNDQGNILCTICNTSIDSSELIEGTLYGANAGEISADILQNDPHACNTFDDPDKVSVTSWKAEKTESGFKCEIPAGSVVSIKINVR